MANIRGYSMAFHGKDFWGTTVGLTKGAETETISRRPTAVQAAYLKRGLGEPGGKLPLFDGGGLRVKDATVKACLREGWCEPWYRNPIKPDWLVCKLTDAGRRAVSDMGRKSRT